MSRSKLILVLACLSCLLGSKVRSQQPALERPSAPTGSVTGFVYYAESRLPARFAEVHIVPMPSDADVVPIEDQQRPPAKFTQRSQHVQSASGTSGMDGSFRVDGVPVGDYLVTAIKPGYISPDTPAAMDWSLSEDQVKSLIASLPQVHVGAGQAASVSLTLHHGAVITGRVQFADGTPVIGAWVGSETVGSAERIEAALLPENRGKVPSPRQETLQVLASSQSVAQKLVTDDEGRYRISGLLPGKYLVGTMIFLNYSLGRVVMSDGSEHRMGRVHMGLESIPVYAPETFRRKEAKVFEVHEGEQITDADLTINPNGVHTVSGKVVAAEDRHSPVTLIRLTEDGAGNVGRQVETEDDGSFLFNYLPSGSYTLQILISYDLPKHTGSDYVEPAHYKSVKHKVLIGEHDVVLDDVLLVPLKPGEHDPESIF